MDKLKIGIVGTGRFARSLALTMPDRITGVIGRNPDQTEAVAGLAKHASAIVSLSDILLYDINLFWLATSDSAITIRSAEIAALRENWSGTLIVHSSGATPLAALDSFKQKGGEVLALHPNVSLTGHQPIPHGLLWSVSVSDSAVELVDHILAGLNPRLVQITEELRPLYHAAASAAANYTVTLFALAQELYQRAGVDPQDAASVVAAFMHKSVERSFQDGPRQALTGPVARGDVDVVHEQLRLVQEHAPELYDAVQGLVEATEWLVRRKNEG